MISCHIFGIFTGGDVAGSYHIFHELNYLYSRLFMVRHTGAIFLRALMQNVTSFAQDFFDISR